MILCTNDDGLGAKGLDILEQACRGVDEVVTLAPDSGRSQCSHSIGTDHLFQVCPVSNTRAALNGWPADCVRIAIDHYPTPFRLVCAGINMGGNLGVDICYSGTVGATREAIIHGYSAIAFSMVMERDVEPRWDFATEVVHTVLDKANASLQSDSETLFWNVNIPARPLGNPQPIECPPDPSPLERRFERKDNTYGYEGNYHARPRQANSDVDLCFQGHVTLSKLKLF